MNIQEMKVFIKELVEKDPMTVLMLEGDMGLGKTTAPLEGY